ncbi:TPA: hypothetical protein ACGA5D_003586, partial [Enterococcus faecalis]
VKPDKPVIPVDPSKPIPPDKDPTPPGKNSDEPKGSDHKQPGGGTGQFVNNGQDTPSSIGLPIAAATVASWEKLADRANALNQAIANTLGLKQAKTIAQEANSGKETTQKDKNNRSDSKDGTSDAARSSKENGKQDKNNQTTSSASESEQADSSQEEQGINNVVHAIKKGIFVALMLILLLSIGTAIYLLIKNKKRNEEK